MRTIRTKPYQSLSAHLRTDAIPDRYPAGTHHRAPHKPLLLLTILDLFAQGAIPTNLIELTPDLGDLFTRYWARVMPPDRRGNLAMPFFHLRSDGFWHLIPRPGKEVVLEHARRIHSIQQLRDTVLGARLDDELYTQLHDPAARDLLRTVLIDTYFAPALHTALVEEGAIHVEAFHYSRRLLEEARGHALREGRQDGDDVPAPVRDQGFRRAVVTAYDHRCALCGIRMLTPDGHTVVDAAHIKPWSLSHDDDPRNGMALCRLCHWTFDQGLLTVSPTYAVLVSPQLRAAANVPGHLVTLDRRPILGPAEEPLWPSLDALAWHRRTLFLHR